MIAVTPQPSFSQYHEWRGSLVYEGSLRQWCWRDRVISNRWNGIEGCTAALSAIGEPFDLRAAYVVGQNGGVGVWYWVPRDAFIDEEAAQWHDR